MYWTNEEIESLRTLYSKHQGSMVPLSEWARDHGRHKTNVSRKGRELGLTERWRPKHHPRKSTAKWETDEERRAAVGEATRKYIATHGHPRGATGLKHTTEARAQMGAASRRMWATMTPEQQEAMVVKRNATNLARYGTTAPPVLRGDQPYSRCQGGRRADLENRYFRSGWEANYARYLNFLLSQGQIQSWEYEPRTFVFEGVTRGAITYTPDFRVTENDGTVIYHEVKGWLTPRAKMAMKRMAEHYPDVQIRLVDEPVYRVLNRQCRGMLPNWE